MPLVTFAHRPPSKLMHAPAMVFHQDSKAADQVIKLSIEAMLECIGDAPLATLRM